MLGLTVALCSGPNPAPREHGAGGGGVDSDTFTLEKADRTVREPVLRISTGAPGNPNPSLSLKTSPEGRFPQCDLRVRHLSQCKQHPKALTCKGVLEHGKGLAPLEHIIDPKLWAEDAGENPGGRQGSHQGCSPPPWVQLCPK